MSNELVTRLRSLRVVLGTDSPETRGWAPAVQREARRVIDAAISALSPAATVCACGAGALGMDHAHDCPNRPAPRGPIPVERLRAMRSEARASDECEREHWFILFARAIEAAHGIGVGGRVERWPVSQDPLTQLQVAAVIHKRDEDASGVKVLAKHQPCGCVICTCEDEVQCHGCGAKNCGTHPVGQFPNPAYGVDVPAPLRLTEEEREHIHQAIDKLGDYEYLRPGLRMETSRTRGVLQKLFRFLPARASGVPGTLKENNRG